MIGTSESMDFLKTGANHVLFKDRQHAGILLAEKLTAYGNGQVLIFGLARGGVVTAKSIADHLQVPIDVLVIKKLSSPLDREFAIGALAPEKAEIIHWKEAQRSGADEMYVHRETQRLSREISTLMATYRKGKKPVSLVGKSVLLIDDGAATGATMEAAVLWAKRKKAKNIVVAVPVISAVALRKLKPEVDDIVVYHTADEFVAVGDYYESFPQVAHEEVVSLVRGNTL